MTAGQAFPPDRPAASSLREHVVRTLILAGPVMVARAGILVLVAVDVAMTGHAGSVELAYYGLAAAPQVPMLLVGIGLLMGTVVLTAQAVGAGESWRCGGIWRVSLAHALGLGVILLLLSQFGEEFLLLTGQTADLAQGGGKVLATFGWGLPAMMLFSATTFFLEGINRTLPGMITMLLANILNAGLNWLMIYGKFGMPAMGAEGAALATTLVRWFMVAALIGYVMTKVDPDAFGIRIRSDDPWDLGRRLRRIGYPMGLSHGMEAGAFATMVIFSGWLGPAHVGGFQIAMNLVALAFMAAIGLGAAASVRVANAVGRQDPLGVRLAGWVCVGLAALFLGTVGLLFLIFAKPLALAYTSDSEVLAIAAATVFLAGIALVPDGIQGVLMSALRGTSDVWPAATLYFICFWLIMVPLGYLFGVAWQGVALPDLWWRLPSVPLRRASA